MTTVYLVRHGEAEGNVYRRCHGQYNSLITPRGYLQIEKVAKRFENIKLDKIYSSDLFRARTTAEGIANKKGMEVIQNSGLREIFMGSWEDKPWAELQVFHKEKYERWMKHPYEFKLPDSESIIEAGERAFNALAAIVKDNPNSKIAVVAHGSVIRGILCLAHGWKVEERLQDIGWGDNTCVSKLIFDGDKIIVEYMNDDSHLPDEISTFKIVKWVGEESNVSLYQMWFKPCDIEKDRELILSFARDKYISAYGNDIMLDEDAFIEETRQMIEKNDRSVTLGMIGDEVAALIRMNVLDESIKDTGVVGSFVIKEKYRGKGFAPQILGQGISVYREIGKSYILAKAAEKNDRAIGFYLKNGFENLGLIDGHYQMRKKIKVS